MLVRLTDIPTEGLNVNNTIPLSSLNARLNESEGNDIEFIDPPHVALHVSHERGGAQVSGSVHSAYTQPCPRCLEVLRYEIQRQIELTLKPRTERLTQQKGAQSEILEEDIGIAYYTGEHIDLEDLVQEALILGLSPFGQEHENCPGYSEAVKDTSGQTSTFGELLKKAGLEN